MTRIHQLGVGFLAACAVSLVPQVSSAVTIPVEYIVDAKDLKKNAPAGTILTIELHQDAACSGAIATEAVNVEALALIESIKTAVIKNASKAPKQSRLHYVFTGISPTVGGDLFVKITATTGITPVGGVCQVQEPIAPTGVIGPTGPTGSTGPTGALG